MLLNLSKIFTSRHPLTAAAVSARGLSSDDTRGHDGCPFKAADGNFQEGDSISSAWQINVVIIVMPAAQKFN